MAFPLLAAAGAMLGGKVLDFLGKKKQANQQAAADRGPFERNAAAQAARAQFLKSMMQGFGVGDVVDAGTMGKLTTPVPFVPGASPSALSFIGSALGDIGMGAAMGGGHRAPSGGEGGGLMDPGSSPLILHGMPGMDLVNKPPSPVKDPLAVNSSALLGGAIR